MSLHTQLLIRTPQDVINDNSMFAEWVNENLTLEGVIRRCPSVMSDIFEEYNNDWIEAVEDEAESLGLSVDADESDDDPDVTDLNMAYDDGYRDALKERGDNAYVYDAGEPREEYMRGYTDGMIKAGGE